MKPHADIIEGPEAFKRFDALVGKVLSVSREEILKREAAYKKQSAARGKKRGPKPKGRAVSRVPVEEPECERPSGD